MGVRDLIAQKLASLNEAGDPIFGQVTPYADGNFTAYPAAVVRPESGRGDVRDTHRIERVLAFEVGLWQEQGESGRTKEEADERIVACADRVVEAFDRDKDLGGEVMIVNVISVQFDFSAAAGARNVARFTVEARVLVPSYPA